MLECLTCAFFEMDRLRVLVVEWGFIVDRITRAIYLRRKGEWR